MNAAADQRAQRGGDRARGRDEPVGARALGLAEVRSDQRHDRGHDQHRAQALQARPADHQHRQVRRQRRRQRPAGVDDAADRERTLAADDLPDLPAGDHQRRHHQRVHRDRRLNPGHRRVEIVGDRRDRRIHHRRVQGHHELARTQRQQDDASRTRSSPCCLRHCRFPLGARSFTAAPERGHAGGVAERSRDRDRRFPISRNGDYCRRCDWPEPRHPAAKLALSLSPARSSRPREPHAAPPVAWQERRTSAIPRFSCCLLAVAGAGSLTLPQVVQRRELVESRSRGNRPTSASSRRRSSRALECRLMDVRASDAERDATVNRLREAATEGRLTLEELTDRIEAAANAVMRSDLVPLTSDLPATAAVGVATQSAGVRG